MTLFLTLAFLRRLQLIWKPELKAFLLGSRNFFFFTPDSAVETQEITPESIDLLLLRQNAPPVSGLQGPANANSAKSVRPHWELLGYLSPEETDLPGYASVVTGGIPDPSQWKASVSLLKEGSMLLEEIEIRIGEE